MYVSFLFLFFSICSKCCALKAWVCNKESEDTHTRTGTRTHTQIHKHTHKPTHKHTHTHTLVIMLCAPSLYKPVVCSAVIVVSSARNGAVDDHVVCSGAASIDD